MPLPQFPNVFYGSIKMNGEPAREGLTVTAVIGNREFSLPVSPRGKFGSGNGLKLKVGGEGADIEDGARIAFYCTDGPVRVTDDGVEAGHAHFHADYYPHVTRLSLCQD